MPRLKLIWSKATAEFEEDADFCRYHFKFSPDDTYIAISIRMPYATDDDPYKLWGVYILDTRTKALHKLGGIDNQYVGRPCFAPCTADVVIRQLVDYDYGPVRLHHFAGGAWDQPFRVLQNHGITKSCKAAFSPDGLRFALSERTGVAVYQQNGGKLSSPVEPRMTDWGKIGKVAWSADGRFLLRWGSNCPAPVALHVYRVEEGAAPIPLAREPGRALAFLGDKLYINLKLLPCPVSSASFASLEQSKHLGKRRHVSIGHIVDSAEPAIALHPTACVSAPSFSPDGRLVAWMALHRQDAAAAADNAGEVVALGIYSVKAASLIRVFRQPGWDKHEYQRYTTKFHVQWSIAGSHIFVGASHSFLDKYYATVIRF